MRCALACFGAFASIGFLSQPVLGQTAVTTAFSAGADTFVANDSQHNGTSVHGTENSMAIRRFDGTRQKLAYMRFDISGVSGPMVDAFLSVNIESTANRDRAFDLYGIIDGPNDNWTEATLNYDSLLGLLAPSAANNGEAAAFDLTEVTLLGRVGMTGSAAQVLHTNNAEADTDLDTSGAILNFINADTNDLVSFIMVMATSDSTASYFVTSKEGNVVNPARIAPTLTIIPEPATAGLALLGLTAACSLARRRR